MSCISANATGKGCLTASVSRVGNGIDCAVKMLGSNLTATLGRLGDTLKVNIGLICTPNTNVYLKVEPQVLWLAPDSVEQFDIYSNTSWIINITDK